MVGAGHDPESIRAGQATLGNNCVSCPFPVCFLGGLISVPIVGCFHVYTTFLFSNIFNIISTHRIQ